MGSLLIQLLGGFACVALGTSIFWVSGLLIRRRELELKKEQQAKAAKLQAEADTYSNVSEADAECERLTNKWLRLYGAEQDLDSKRRDIKEELKILESTLGFDHQDTQRFRVRYTEINTLYQELKPQVKEAWKDMERSEKVLVLVKARCTRPE